MKPVHRYQLVVCAALFAMPGAYAQNAACSKVEFSDAVLQRFPRARDACLDVIEHEGQQYAVFKADVVRTEPNKLSLKFKLPDGTYAATRTIKADPARRIDIEGKPTRVQDVAVGQELTAYVSVSKPEIALAPVSITEVFYMQPLEGETTLAEANTATMPETASPVPGYGLAGVLLLVIAGALSALRRFSSDRR